VGHPVPNDEKDLKRWPNLMACLTPRWEGNRLKRKEGRLTITPSGGCFLVTLGIPTEGLMCSLEVNSLADCLDALEKLLRSGKANWRADWESRKKVAKLD